MTIHISQKEIHNILEEYSIAKWSYSENLVPLSFNHFNLWRKKNRAGPLKYLLDYRGEMRSSLRKYFPECQSAMVFLFDYSQSRRELEKIFQSDESNGAKIASYTLGFQGHDYHYDLGQVLERIQVKIYEKFGIKSKKTLDVHPVLERDLAYSSGLGWFGKNSMLINKEIGSYTMIGSLLLDNKLNLGKSIPDLDHCGNCVACIESCPTDAIDGESRTIDANKCISTFTIEMFKDCEPPKGIEKFAGEIFGCDICQDVCPWNSKHLDFSNVPDHNFSEKSSFIIDNFLLTPISELMEKINAMSNREYKRWVQGTSFERLGRVGILKNLKTFLRIRGNKFND